MAKHESFNVAKNLDFGKSLGASTIVTKPETPSVSDTSDRRPKINESHEVQKESSLNNVDVNSSSVEDNGTDKKAISSAIVFGKKKKENRSVQKSFLITPTIQKNLSETAKEIGVSQNDLLNDILNQVFNIVE